MKFNNIINFYQDRINNELKKIINKINLKNSILLNAIKYSTLEGGKRIRPLLVYLTGRMLKSNIKSLDTVAVSIELMHNYSLIHDDLPIIDNDDIRRGNATCHIKFGENIAILAGNSLQSLAFSVLSDEPMPYVTLKNRISMISILAKSSGILGMCLGQSFDIISEGKKINLKFLNNINKYKTISLIRAAVRLGALTAGKYSYKFLPALDSYAKAIGAAFQIKNDILDIHGNINITGKKTGSDKKLKKNTYPSLIGLKKSKLKILNFYKVAIQSLNIIESFKINVKELKDLAKLIVNIDK